MCFNSTHSQAWLLISSFFSSSVCSKVGHIEAGKSISIPCLYESQYIDHVKYLCEGYIWDFCRYVVKSNEADPLGKYLISDDKNQKIFTVIINELTDKNTDYWCVVEIDNGPDYGQYFQLLFISGKCLFSCTFQIVYHFRQKNVSFSERLNVLLFLINSLDMKIYWRNNEVVQAGQELCDRIIWIHR
uniref:Polymeric immunoglobulin receptor-like n=1 Tax=Neolamprologus brichardi TaxID=32507 RepID=A0A3Q4GFU7_NEOBR